MTKKFFTAEAEDMAKMMVEYGSDIDNRRTRWGALTPAQRQKWVILARRLLETAARNEKQNAA
jgi:hypothetical protein